MKAARSAYSTAREYGDVDGEVAAQERLNAAQINLNNLRQQQEAWQRAPISSGDAFEDHLSNFTSRTADWMRAHKDLVTDPRSNSKLVGCHHLALGEGLVPDSDEYFSFVENKMGLKNGGGNGRSGNVQRGSSDGGNAVRLSKGEVERANDGSIQWGRHDLAAGRIKDASMIGKPIGNVEYARRRIEMQKQGYYRSE